MDTRAATALNDMTKQIDELCSSQAQQMEGICKELGDKINALEGLIEKFIAAQTFTQREGKQAEETSEITDRTPRPRDPPDRLNPEQSTSKTTATNINNNNNNQPTPTS